MDGKLRAGASLLSHSGAGVDGGEGLESKEEQKKRRVVRGDPRERANWGCWDPGGLTGGDGVGND